MKCWIMNDTQNMLGYVYAGNKNKAKSIIKTINFGWDIAYKNIRAVSCKGLDDKQDIFKIIKKNSGYFVNVENKINVQILLNLRYAEKFNRKQAKEIGYDSSEFETDQDYMLLFYTQKE